MAHCSGVYQSLIKCTVSMFYGPASISAAWYLEIFLHACVLKHALHIGNDIYMYYNKSPDFMHLHPAPLTD